MLRLALLVALLTLCALAEACTSGDEAPSPTGTRSSAIATTASPPGYPLSVRTGERGVDAVLARVEARDTSGLWVSVDYREVPCEEEGRPECEGSEAPGTIVSALPWAFSCAGDLELARASQVRGELASVAALAKAVYGVAQVPEDSPSGGDHLLLIVTDPQDGLPGWGMTGIVERAGRIVGLRIGCPDFSQSPLWGDYIADPLGENDSLRRDRRSGDPLIDAALDALNDGGPAALEGLVDYEEVACVTEATGADAGPLCAEDEAAGTPVMALEFSRCTRYRARPSEVLDAFGRFVPAPWGLHFAVELEDEDEDAGGGMREAVVLAVGSFDPITGMLAFTFDDRGITGVRTPCGYTSLESPPSGSANPSDFLLPRPTAQ